MYNILYHHFPCFRKSKVALACRFLSKLILQPRKVPFEVVYGNWEPDNNKKVQNTLKNAK